MADITPHGERFLTIPTCFFDEDLTYMPGASEETQSDGTVILGGTPETGQWWPQWSQMSGPTFLGSRLFWVTPAFLEIYLFAIFFQPPGGGADSDDDGHDGTFNDLGPQEGGMDDLMIYRPEDLLKREEISEEDQDEITFGEVLTQAGHAYLVTHSSGFMDDGDFIPQQAWICPLQPRIDLGIGFGTEAGRGIPPFLTYPTGEEEPGP